MTIHDISGKIMLFWSHMYKMHVLTVVYCDNMNLFNIPTIQNTNGHKVCVGSLWLHSFHRCSNLIPKVLQLFGQWMIASEERLWAAEFFLLYIFLNFFVSTCTVLPLAKEPEDSWFKTAGVEKRLIKVCLYIIFLGWEDHELLNFTATDTKLEIQCSERVGTGKNQTWWTHY